MTSDESLERFGNALLNTLEEAAPEESASDEECRALIRFTELAVASARRRELDRARDARLRAQEVQSDKDHPFGELGRMALGDLLRLVENLSASAPELVMQHRELSEMTREDLESLVHDLLSVGVSSDLPDKPNG